MSNKSALGAFSPYNPDYGRNAALLAFGATMLQNAGRQPFGRGAPISTAQALGSAGLAGLGAYGQAEQRQYARTKPNYQVINDQLVSITPPTERGGQPTIETIKDLRTPTDTLDLGDYDPSDYTVKSLTNYRLTGDPSHLERYEKPTDNVADYDPSDYTVPSWAAFEAGGYKNPDKLVRYEKLTDTTKYTTPIRGIEFDANGNEVRQHYYAYDKNTLDRYSIDPTTGTRSEETLKLPEGHTLRDIGQYRATEKQAGDMMGKISEDARAMETALGNQIALYTNMKTKFSTPKGKAALGMTGGLAQFMDTTTEQFKNVATLLKGRRLDPAVEKERADSLEKYLTGGQIDLNKVEQDSEIAGWLDKAVNTGFIKGIAVDAAKKKSMILNLAYQMAASENDGRPSDKDVKSAIQRLGGSTGSHAQLLGAIEGTIETGYTNYKNYLTNAINWNPALKDRIKIRGLDTSIDEGGFGYVPQGTTTIGGTQTTPFETFSPEQLRANPNLEERQTANGTIYFVPKRQ